MQRHVSEKPATYTILLNWHIQFCWIDIITFFVKIHRKIWFTCKHYILIDASSINAYQPSSLCPGYILILLLNFRIGNALYYLKIYWRTMYHSYTTCRPLFRLTLGKLLYIDIVKVIHKSENTVVSPYLIYTS
jgi:hypothetical protein